MITDYHSKYIACELTRRRSSDSAEKLAAAVAGAQVEDDRLLLGAEIPSLGEAHGERGEGFAIR